MNAKSRSDMQRLAFRLNAIPEGGRDALASAIMAAGLMRSQWWMHLLVKMISWRQGMNLSEAWTFAFYHNPGNIAPLIKATADWIVSGKDASGEGIGGFNQAEVVTLDRILNTLLNAPTPNESTPHHG